MEDEDEEKDDKLVCCSENEADEDAVENDAELEDEDRRELRREGERTCALLSLVRTGVFHIVVDILISTWLTGEFSMAVVVIDEGPLSLLPDPRGCEHSVKTDALFSSGVDTASSPLTAPGPSLVTSR